MVQYNTALFILDDFDQSTYYGAYFMQYSVNHARQKGLETIVISGQDVNEQTVQKAIQDYDPYYVIAEGHGCLNIVLGSQTSDIFYIPPGCQGRLHDTSNIANLKDRVVFLLACDTDNLTKAISDVGAKGIWGFTEEFGWIVDSAGGYKPDEDKYAPAFFSPVVNMINGILDGGDVTDLAQKYKTEIDSFIQLWNTVDDPKSEVVTSWLDRNKDSLIVFSDGSLVVGGVTVGVFGLLLLAALAYFFLKGGDDGG